MQPSGSYNPSIDYQKNQSKISHHSKEVHEWFNLTDIFLNNVSTNLPCNNSLVPNTHNIGKKKKYFPKNQSINTRNPKYISKILPTATKSHVTKKISKKLSIDQIIANEKKKRYHSFESYLYSSSICMPLEVCNEFEIMLGKHATNLNALKPIYNKSNFKPFKCKCAKGKNSNKSDSFSSSDKDSDDENYKLKELAIKCAHPDRLHPEIWYNELGELNDGPVCRCNPNLPKLGIFHNIYVGDVPFEPCLPNKNNADKLYHYRITITPLTNYLHKYPTIIKHKHNNYTFEGFSLLSHYPISTMPPCTFTRFNINYTILYIEEKIPDNFILQEVKIFCVFFFKDILELLDFNFYDLHKQYGCPQFHFLPRFIRNLSNNNKDLLSMISVLKYLLNSNKLLFEENSLPTLKQMSSDEWQDIVDEYKGMIITNPETKPSSIRVDHLDREYTEDTTDKKNKLYPVVVHFGIRPAQICYVGNAEFKKYSTDYFKIKHLLDNKINPSPEDEKKLEIIVRALQEMSSNDKMRRKVTTVFSSKGFYKTGLMCDIAQHAMILPVLVSHIKFNKSLEYLEKSIRYKFKDQNLLKVALTYSSYLDNYGTNKDHIRNTLTNCGIRHPEYGDRQNRIYKKKRGINIMSQFGEIEEIESNFKNNERLVFLGDAVIELVTSIHVFNAFPDLQEGDLSKRRSGIMNKRHYNVLAKNLKLEDFILYDHSSYLCTCFENAKVLTNCLVAVIGAIYLDGGINAADYVFGEMMCKASPEDLRIWVNNPKHQLQQEPKGDRECIEISPLLKKLTKFEKSINVKFNHIKLLAKAITHRSMGVTNFTFGSNQRLEFLGDSVLKLVTSDYLYRHYPEHQSGQLSVLRSSLVNNQFLSVVCNDLGIVNYAIHSNQIREFQTKDRADFVEALIGALYLDKGLGSCHAFCNVFIISQLPNSIKNQDWNNSKSKLIQCFQTLQYFRGGNPEMPIYKTIKITGPDHCPQFTVGVYFKNVMLSMENGQSTHKAEMNAATSALKLCKDLFPQLDRRTNGNINYMTIRQMIETISSKNDSCLSKSEKQRNKLKFKLLTVLYSGKDYTDEVNKKHVKEEEVDEPERKKFKKEPGRGNKETDRKTSRDSTKKK